MKQIILVLILLISSYASYSMCYKNDENLHLLLESINLELEKERSLTSDFKAIEKKIEPLVIQFQKSMNHSQ